jgi:hypothetical protein
LVLHQLKKSLDFFTSYDKLRNEFDSSSFADNKENFSNSEQYQCGFSPKYKYNKGEIVLNSSASSIEELCLILVVFILQITKCECRCIQ